MRQTLLILGVALALIFAGVCASRVRIVQTEQFCSNAKSWHLTFGPPNATNLGLTSGVYRARSYSLTNGFGLRPPGQSWLSVPFAPRPGGTKMFGP